jgi:hypothetical protein
MLWLLLPPRLLLNKDGELGCQDALPKSGAYSGREHSQEINKTYTCKGEKNFHTEVPPLTPIEEDVGGLQRGGSVQSRWMMKLGHLSFAEEHSM